MDYGTQRMIEASAQTGFASEDAEKALLGSIVSRYDMCAQLLSELSVEDFYFDAHKTIFQAVKQAKTERLAIDLVTVGSTIDKIAPQAGNTLTQILVGCTRAAEPWAAESHCRIVKELSARRRAIDLVGRVRQELMDPSNDINGTIDLLATASSELLVSGHKWTPIQDVLVEAYEYTAKRASGEITSITSGISNLDHVIGGFFGGELTVVGARPAVGKSVFGMNTALAAAKQGYRVGIVSREMTDIQYGQRILSYAGGVDGSNLRRAKLSLEEWDSLAKGLEQASTLPISFLFTVRTVEDLRAEIQRKFNRHEIDMLVVDYLQLMETAQRYREDRLRVGRISKELKNIAVDFNIPVVALAQVRRFAGGARAKMPTLEDLKDSGSIEQDADNVIFLHNPFDAEDDFVDPRDKAHFDTFAERGYTYQCLGVAKQRQGVTGVCCVLHEKRRMRYLTIDRTRGTT